MGRVEWEWERGQRHIAGQRGLVLDKLLLHGACAGRAPQAGSTSSLQAVAAKSNSTLRDNWPFSGLLSTAHLFYFLAQRPLLAAAMNAKCRGQCDLLVSSF